MSRNVDGTRSGDLAPAHVERAGGSTAADRWALARLQGWVASAPVRFALWDGYALPRDLRNPAGTIVFNTRRALFSWIWDAELYFGETYMTGDVEVRGDLIAVLEAIYRAWTPQPRPWWLWQKSNSVEAARDNVHHHYDLGNDFYKLWLDQNLVYTCAYFPDPALTLEEAQVAKMDLVCRKLALRAGEHVVEAGCGWGALALHMAAEYGVSVRAFNVSREQIAYAREQARARHLESRVEFVEEDYRGISGEFDVFVSIGMLEHVGLADYPTLGDVMHRSLGTSGRGLLHFIGRNAPAPLNAWIRRRIFPGAYPPALREVFEYVVEPHGFSVLDVENLRLHYARTLQHWRERFGRHVDRVRQMFDDRFVRAWELYLAGSQAAFTTGSMQLFQVVVARGSSNAIPWTRYSGAQHM